MFSAVTVLNCAPYFSTFLGRELCDNLSLILQKPGFSWAAEGSGVERLDLGYRCTWQHGLSYAWWTLPDQRDDHSDSQPLLCDSFLVTEKGLWKQGVLPQLSHDGFTNLLGFLFGFDRKWVPLLPSIHWAERRQLPELQPVSSKRNQTLLWRSILRVLYQLELNFSWQPRSREVLHLFVLPRHLIF